MPVRQSPTAIACFLSSLLLAGEIRAATQAVKTTLSFHSDPADPAYGAVDFQPSSGAVIAALRRLASADALQNSFRVVVDDARHSATDVLAVLGRYQLLADRVRFTSLFPPQPGVRYRAIADFAGVLEHAAPAPATLEFAIAKTREGPATVVERVYPSGAVLPANLLRFYVWFSRPMQEGYARNHVVLLGPDGSADAAAFLPSAKELWNPSMQRLTVLLHPGRIKRGVGPNLELGPPLREGRIYTLKISAGMVDANGRSIHTSYSKRFKVSEADRSAVDPRQWRIRRPPAGTEQPLTVMAPQALDQAVFARTVRIVHVDHSPVAGSTSINQGETRWSFVPESPWTPGYYLLEVDTALEDVAGNTTWGPFDMAARDAAPPPGPTGRIELPILIAAP